MPISEVKGNGTTSVKHDYEFTDKTPSVKTNYYRLRQADFGEKEIFSPIVSVVFNLKTHSFSLKNTLVHDELVVETSETVPLNISIFNSFGQQVYSGKVQGNQRIDTRGLAVGLYLIQPDKGEVARFVKE